MSICRIATASEPRFELRFAALFQQGRALSFPCDAAGRVDLNTLSDRARSNYFFARGLVGRDFAPGAVRSCVPLGH